MNGKEGRGRREGREMRGREREREKEKEGNVVKVVYCMDNSRKKEGQVISKKGRKREWNEGVE